MLALLPTATTNILEVMTTEKITLEIQQMKSAAKGARGGDSTAAPPSIADTTMTEEEGRSVISMQSDSGVHASQVTLPPPPSYAAAAAAAAEGTPAASEAASPTPIKARKTKRQLWDDLTISCTSQTRAQRPTDGAR